MAGILVCGLNGCGKSTLGRALAERLGYRFIDNEDLYFPKTDAGYLYAAPRSREEVETLLLEKVREHPDFVFAAVRGDYGAAVLPLYRWAVLLEVPREVRIERVRERSFRKFGGRMLPSGDLYEKEEAFFSLVASRPGDFVEAWLPALRCPVVRVDGTRPVAETVDLLLRQLGREGVQL